MFHKSFPLLVIGLWGVIVLPLPNRVSAITPLTRAEIQNLRNMVQLIPKDKLKKRPARKLDAMIPGDGLSTGRASLADLRFNDGSLARIGEQALFQFLPKTRDFKLSNGTVLLLIPPGKGQTRIQTPNAAAAIRGSALFVRYDQQTDTTIVGALTNSGIEVSNKEASETQVLEAGQMVIIVKGKFERLYDFDLRNFYETSQLVRELDLNRQSPVPTPDPAITSVQAETAAALEAQPPIKGEGVIENPSFVQLTPTPDTPTETKPDTPTETTPVTSTEKKPDTPTKTTPVTSTEAKPDTSTKTTPVTSTEKKPDTPTKTTPITSTEKKPDTPTETTPDTPPKTTPVTSTEKKPDTPTKTTPVTPIEKLPNTPIEELPNTPIEELPNTPTETTPITPTETTPVTPTETTPVTPTETTPVTPTETTPITPTETTPVTPTETTPVTPTETTPVTPTETTPVTPTETTPVTPTETTPVTPTETTPVTPTETTPVTPTDSPST
ncbi:FecR domain-containing protein [Nostoc foliaceum]|uniref:FecR domain-containing protein n=1 Tax=Nostoc foliaceum FACHB-393 TaxID=2692915 RepID=A0ABR8I5X6_9NOSO|nr:FecR domain-containing protein [Nostoc foliaceum]MBD2646128.1 FecR domain-containing protein [Nostoc foliaceum FACHB-393]